MYKIYLPSTLKGFLLVTRGLHMLAPCAVQEEVQQVQEGDGPLDCGTTVREVGTEDVEGVQVSEAASPTDARFAQESGTIPTEDVSGGCFGAQGGGRGPDG